MQSTKTRRIVSAVYSLLIVGIIAGFFIVISEPDPKPADSTLAQGAVSAAIAETATAASPSPQNASAISAHPQPIRGVAGALEGSDGVPSENARRSSSGEAATSAAGQSAVNDPADDASAEDLEESDSARAARQAQETEEQETEEQDRQAGDRDNRKDDRDEGAGDQNGDEEDNDGELYEIAGQVVDEGGRPISRIGVVATARRLFDEEAAFGFGDVLTEASTVADASGHFQFRGLANGEYEISTVATDYYPKVASKAVRAGVNNAKLVITDEREIMIDGYVASAEGRPLGGVEVYASAAGAEPVAVSGANGYFGFPLTVRGDRGALLTLFAEGYQDQKVNLTRNDWHGLPQVEIDVVMQPAQQLTTVSGVVRSKAGDPVVGEQVYLKGSNAKYKGVTDAAGRFSLDQVAVGGNYALWIMPKGPYEKHRQDRLTVPAGGLNNLDIVLEPLGFGTLMGRMFDTKGNAVPGFTLFARSDSARGASVQVTSDYEGYFVAEDVPEGRLRIESGSFPRFVVSGIQLPEGGEVDVDVVLDVGSQQITGRVTDDLGRPLAGADITLSWVLRENSLVHESLRKTTSGADGGFQFTKVGGGTYRIIARAPGFEVAQLDEDIGGGYGGGGNVDLQLVPLAE